MPQLKWSLLRYFCCVWWAVLGDKGAHLPWSVASLVFLLLISSSFWLVSTTEWRFFLFPSGDQLCIAQVSGSPNTASHKKGLCFSSPSVCFASKLFLLQPRVACCSHPWWQQSLLAGDLCRGLWLSSAVLSLCSHFSVSSPAVTK